MKNLYGPIRPARSDILIFPSWFKKLKGSGCQVQGCANENEVPNLMHPVNIKESGMLKPGIEIVGLIDKRCVSYVIKKKISMYFSKTRQEVSYKLVHLRKT